MPAMNTSDVSSRILVLDDARPWRTLLNIMLSPKYRPEMCKTVDEAKRALRRTCFMTAIVDICMTGQQENEEGFDLLREIRDLYREDPMNTIVLTGFATPLRVITAFTELKVFHFIEKTGTDRLKDPLLKIIGDAIFQAQSRLGSLRLLTTRYLRDSMVNEIESSLSSQSKPRGQIVGHLDLILKELFEWNRLTPVAVPRRSFGIEHDPGDRAFFVCWSRLLESMFLIEVVRGCDFVDPSGRKWVVDNGWTLTPFGRVALSSELRLKAECFALEGMDFDYAFSEG